MMNPQLKQTIDKLIDCEISVDSLCEKYRIQGFTFSGLDKHLSSEICSESDRFKTYARKKDGTYKGIAAIRLHFNITKNKGNGWNEKAVLKMGALLTSYSNYLGSMGLDPKTCKALVVKKKAVVEQAVVEQGTVEQGTVEQGTVEQGTVELQNNIKKLEKENDTLQQVVQGKEEKAQSVFSAISEILATVSSKDTKATMLGKFQEIGKVVEYNN